MANFSVLISSSDSYSNIWPIFFDLFKRYWPEFKGEIFLQTETLDYKYPGLNIKCTHVGSFDSFGKTFRKGLETIPDDIILLIMIDYIFMGRVDHQKIESLFELFLFYELDSLCLVHQKYPNQSQIASTDLRFVLPPAPNLMFSFQIAFWRKSILHEMVLPHENPWTAEWYGTKRAEKMKVKLACIGPDMNRPIPYDLAGCLHKGKWLSNAVEFLKREGFFINFDQRGYYKEEMPTFSVRLRMKCIFIWHGLKGSYIDLLKRNNTTLDKLKK